MIIRPAVAADLPAVRALLLRSFTDDHGHGYRPDWHADVDDLAGAYLDRPGAAYLVAVDDEQVLGGIGLRPTAPRAPGVRERYQGRGDVAELVRLVVSPAARRRGVASALVDGLLDTARVAGVGTVALHTNAENPTSVGFWLSTGAHVVLDERVDGPADPAFVCLHLEYDLRP